MRSTTRHSLILASIVIGGSSLTVPASIAQTSSVASPAPLQPSISVPRRPAAPIVDDVMTLGTPSPGANVAASSPPPTISRPESRSGGSSVGAAPAGEANALGRMLSGQALVLDGNTLSIRGEIVVLHGADAFEIGQTCNDLAGMTWSCGTKATQHLFSLANGRQVDCVGAENLTGAITAVCSFKGEDLGRAMVREGYAFVAPGTSGYEAEQQAAVFAQRGGWAGTFDYPWVVR